MMLGHKDRWTVYGVLLTLWESVAVIPLLFGCRKSRIRLHRYEWGFGPDAVIRTDGLVEDPGHGWWMYCENCGGAA